MKNKYHVSISKSADKRFAKIPKGFRNKIYKALSYLEIDPFIGEKMWGELENHRKLRVWPYRVIFSIDKKNKLVSVSRIGHRGSIGYK